MDGIPEAIGAEVANAGRIRELAAGDVLFSEGQPAASFSVVLIGSVNSYTEANNRPFGHGRFYNFEWFAQDSWKATRRLTIDYGVRFYKMIPVFSAGDKLAQFSLGAYDPKQAPTLIQPYRATPSKNTYT